MTRRFALAASLLLLGSNATARADDPLKRLETISHFAFGGVGAAGTTSEGERMFRQIVERKDSVEQLEKLLDCGNAQAQCYALVGLHALSPADFAAHARRFAKSRQDVSMITGCMMMKQSLAAVVGSIAAGHYDRYLIMKR